MSYESTYRLFKINYLKISICTSIFKSWNFRNNTLNLPKRNKMTPLQLIISEIKPILKKYPITKAGIFGSFVRNEQTETSDVDILIELSHAISL